MASSPEAHSGSSSSSEDEFDLGASSLKSETAAASTGGKTKLSEADTTKLFSDEEDENDAEAETDSDAKAKTEPASDAEGAGDKPGKSEDGDDKDKEMEDLFGSDYDSEEEEFKASGVKESPSRQDGRSGGTGELLSDDAAETSGALSHGDGEGLWMPKTPKASKTAKHFVTKMPNILRLVPEPYTAEGIKAEMANPSDETLYRNYVRWRYRRDAASGRVLLDESTKLPLREANSKLVQWEDGSFTMFVGKEALNLSRQKLSNAFLFAEEVASETPRFTDSEEGGADVSGQTEVLECHARLAEKFTIRPMTTSSKSHKSLTMSMRAKHNKGVQKLKEYISEMDGERQQEQRVKLTDEKLRLQNRKKARQTFEDDRGRAARMDAQFLEEGYDAMDYDDDEHVGAIKEQFGGRTRKQPASRRGSVAPRRPLPGGGFDEYSSMKNRRELEREADKSESDNDVAADEGEEEEEEEEEVVFRSHKKRRTVDDEDSE